MKRPIFFLIVVMWCSHALADVPINIKGVILEPVCTVVGEDGGTNVDISFGEVNLDAIGSLEAEQPINLKVSCDNSAPTGKTLNMYVHPTSYGILTAVGPNVLGSSQLNLGIALTSGTDGSIPVNLDSWTPVVGIDTNVNEPTGRVVLKARLVTSSASSLQAGAFTSAANLVMSYQ